MAAAVSHYPIDPSKPAKFPISISEQLLREDGPRKRRRVNVQLNHKPDLPSNSTRTTITPSSSSLPNTYDLSITSRSTSETYLYTGSQQPTSSLALIYSPTTSTFTLDRIDSEFRFNIHSTPTNNDASNLAVQYPHLDTEPHDVTENDDDGEGDLFDEHHNPDDEELDPNNPYDYRHFLKTTTTHAGASTSPSPSHLGSPAPTRALTPSPLLTASTSHRPSTTKPTIPKPTKKRPLPKPRHLSPNPTIEADADNEDSSADDVLTIDMGDSNPVTNRRPWRHALGVLNDGQRSGPISLRSAASSMSPSLRGDSENEREEKGSNADVEEIDLEDGGGMGEAETPGIAGSEQQEDEDEDDVDDPFAAELEQKMIEEAMSEAEQGVQGDLGGAGGMGQVNGVNGTQVNRVVEESSEESEEE